MIIFFRVADQHTAVSKGLREALLQLDIKIPSIKSSNESSRSTWIYPLSFLSSIDPSPSLTQLSMILNPTLAGSIDQINQCNKAAAIAVIYRIASETLSREPRSLHFGRNK